MDLINAIAQYLTKEPTDEPRKYIGASSVGKPCLRQIWYAYNGYDKQTIELRNKITFQIGHSLEALILDYLKKAGVIIVCQGKFYSDSSVLALQGHVDGVLVLPDESRAILEIKTAKDSSFDTFYKHGLLKWQESYYTQIQVYMGMSGIHRGVLLAINKNSSEMHEEWVDFDPIYYEEIKLKAHEIAIAESPPPKISDNGSYFICKQCEFRKICHV